jgi:hypothetical protein
MKRRWWMIPPTCISGQIITALAQECIYVVYVVFDKSFECTERNLRTSFLLFCWHDANTNSLFLLMFIRLNVQQAYSLLMPCKSPYYFIFWVISYFHSSCLVTMTNLFSLTKEKLSKSWVGDVTCSCYNLSIEIAKQLFVDCIYPNDIW